MTLYLGVQRVHREVVSGSKLIRPLRFEHYPEKGYQYLTLIMNEELDYIYYLRVDQDVLVPWERPEFGTVYAYLYRRPGKGLIGQLRPCIPCERTKFPFREFAEYYRLEKVGYSYCFVL